MPRRLPPRYPQRPGYARLWRLIDGATKSAFDAHPDWIVPGKTEALRNSIVKRIVGRIQSSEAAKLQGIASTALKVDDQQSTEDASQPQ